MSRSIVTVAFITMTLVLCAGSAFSGPLPDTGQTNCYDDAGNEIPCPQPGEPFHGQDGNYLINPPSYTKLDDQGGDLPDDALTWVMVRDNVTGLIWEVKQNKDDNKDYANPHDADNTYTWYDPNSATNGGYAGTPGDGTDTLDFITALNQARSGGFSDWRLPTPHELLSILDLGEVSPTINTQYFSGTAPLFYWSSLSNINNSYAAWLVDFGGGNFGDGYKSADRCLRAVRSGK